MEQEQIQVVAAVVQVKDRVLICKRPASKRHGGLWEFPGGKVHIDESMESAVARELEEELGVTLNRFGEVMFRIPDPQSPFVINFIDVEIKGTPTPFEHDELLWTSLDDIDLEILAPSDRAFVEFCLNRKAIK